MRCQEQWAMTQVFKIALETPYEFRVGDPSLIGWIITFTYALAFAVCFLNVKYFQGVRRGEPKSPQYWFWCGVACVVFLLGANKQLDLQTWMIEVWRTLARENGWYEERRTYQTFFILITIFCGSAFAAWIIYELRSVWRECAGAVVGLTCLMVFVLIRAASLHQIDGWLAETISGVKLRYILELLGVALVCAAATKNLLVQHPSSSRGK